MPFEKGPRDFHRGRTYSVYLNYPISKRAEAIKKRLGFNDQGLLLHAVVTLLDALESEQEKEITRKLGRG